MMYHKIFQSYLIFSISLLFWSCNSSNNRWDIDVSDVKVTVKIERFDKDFDAIDLKKPLHPQMQALHKKYGAFFEDYIEQIINAGSTKDTVYYANIRKIVTTKPYLELRDTVLKRLPDEKIKSIEAELQLACQHLKYYYPAIKLPRFIAYISGFEVQMPVGDTYIGVGLDMFLGKNCTYYEAIVTQVPKYLSCRFTPENIVPRVMEAYIREVLFLKQDNEKVLLQRMVYNGKVLMLMDAFLPKVADELKIGYTSQQLQWGNSYEGEIWNYFIGENLLYESDFIKTDKYINEAPFTPGLGEKNDSAPKLGRFTGWKIVRKYIETHPKVSISDLLVLNGQQLLEESNYKPK